MGVLAVSWRFPPPPLLTAVVTGFAAVEPRFNTMLFRDPRELEAMGLLPAPQSAVVLAKNLAALVLSLCAALGAAAVLMFFSDQSVSAGDVADAALCWASLVFPLLHAGNRRSLQYPRRISGWRTDDLFEGIGFGFMLTLAVFSLPYLALVVWLAMPALCLLSAALTAALWAWRSVPDTARRIERERAALCSRS